MMERDFSALWLAFRGKGGRERDRVIVGVAAVFAHVSAADGRIDESETQRFLDVVRGSRLAESDAATMDELSRAFEALTVARLRAPELGRAECVRVLTELGLDPMRREIIWSAARAALVADAQLGAEERRAEEEIRAALGIRVGAPR
jgi:tellurite resistance protein